MRAKMIFLASALGAAVLYLKQNPETRAQIKAQSQDLGRKLRDRIEPVREKLQSLGGRSQSQTTRPSATDQDHEALEQMVDDVAHRPDIPDTEMKHAFEEAVEEHHRI